MASRDPIRVAIERAARTHFEARSFRRRGVAFVQPLGEEVLLRATFVVGRDEKPGHIVTGCTGDLPIDSRPC